MVGKINQYVGKKWLLTYPGLNRNPPLAEDLFCLKNVSIVKLSMIIGKEP
jgi:hypothetical protein